MCTVDDLQKAQTTVATIAYRIHAVNPSREDRAEAGDRVPIIESIDPIRFAEKRPNPTLPVSMQNAMSQIFETRAPTFYCNCGLSFYRWSDAKTHVGYESSKD